MKKWLFNWWQTLRASGWGGMILILYCIGILSLDAFVAKEGNLYFVRAVVFIVFLCFAVCPYLFCWAKKPRFSPTEQKPSGEKKQFLFYFGVPLVCFLVLYGTLYPVAFSNDSVQQYNQAMENAYDNWHPVLHTLLFFKLPLLLTGGWEGSVSLFQILAFSLAVGYSFTALRQYAGKKFTLVAFFLILFNPQSWSIAIFPWKDNAFATCVLALVGMFLHIYFSRGQWLQKPFKAIAFVVLLVTATLLRHNGILFTLPFLIAALLCSKWKTGVSISAGAVALYLCLLFPVWGLLQVEKPDSRQTEMLGLPMTVIGNVVSQDPQSAGEEVLEFAYLVAPQSVWEQEYSKGSFNSIKWHPDTDTGVIEQYGAVNVLKLMGKCFLRSPKTALTALIQLTGPVYTVSGDYLLWNPLYDQKNATPAQAAEATVFHKLVYGFSKGTMTLFPHIFMYFGVGHLLLLTLVLAKWEGKSRQFWQKLLAVMGIFVYNYGTMLLLTGYSDTNRFFGYTRLILPALVFVWVADRKKEEQTPVACEEQ